MMNDRRSDSADTEDEKGDEVDQQGMVPIQNGKSSTNTSNATTTTITTTRLTWKKIKAFPVIRRKLQRTCFIAFTFFGLGTNIGLIGPTFMDLQIITNTGLEEASVFLTGGAVGYLIGSFIGGVMFERVDVNLLGLVLSLGTGVTTIATTFCSTFELMLFIHVINGAFSGCLDTVSNARQMRMWGADGEALMQFIHFCFTLGATLPPLYCEPFLAKELTNETTPVEWTNQSNVANYSMDINSSSEKHWGETNVFYAFLLTGIIVSVTSVPYGVLYCVQNDEMSQAVEVVEAEPRKLPKPLFLFTIFVLCLFFMFYCNVDDLSSSYLMTFLVNEYDTVSKSKGAFATAVLWASFTVSRLMMIFVAHFFSAFQLLCFCSSLMLLSYTGFVICASYGLVNALIFFSAAVGFSMSAIFPSGLSWTDKELVKGTGGVSSAILVSMSFGSASNPLLIGYLMEEIDNMWFGYLLVIQTVLMCSTFIFLAVLFRCCVHKHYGLVSGRLPDTAFTVAEPDMRQALNEAGQAKSESVMSCDSI